MLSMPQFSFGGRKASLDGMDEAPVNKKEQVGNDRGMLLYLLRSEKTDNAEGLKEVSQAIASSVHQAMMVLALVVLFFGVWGSLAPIDSAAIAPGSVILQSSRKTIQHLEGGIVDDIFVKDGDTVIVGQPLVRLDSTQAKARQQQIAGQLAAAHAAQARLLAERDGQEAITFPDNLISLKNNTEIAKIISSQESLFLTRTRALKGQVEVLEQQIAQYDKQIQGMESQIASVKEQSVLIAEEVKSVQELFDQGLSEKPRLLALKRSKADLSGREGEYLSQISKIRESITETKLQVFNIQNEYLKQTAAELEETQKNIADLEEQLRASRDVLDRTTVFAPQSGKVTGLKFHTIGGVIAPGTPIMEIVPQNDRLIIEASVSPQDIDVVHEGLEAKVMLSAYKSRFVPRLSGKVIHVSADRFTDENTGQPYYLARVEISEGVLEKLSADVELYPGMPAETFIVTGSRTFLGYMLSPIIDSFHRAFKEE